MEGLVEDLNDRNWELKEAEERAKSFLEAQGDVIVRRDGELANGGLCPKTADKVPVIQSIERDAVPGIRGDKLSGIRKE